MAGELAWELADPKENLASVTISLYDPGPVLPGSEPLCPPLYLKDWSKCLCAAPAAMGSSVGKRGGLCWPEMLRALTVHSVGQEG